MTDITLSKTSFGHASAASQINKFAGELKTAATDLSSGKSIKREEIATAAVARLSLSSTQQYAQNTQRAQNILSQAISDLSAVLEQLRNAQTVAAQVASQTKTADEIAVLSATFTQLMSAANGFAQNSSFLGENILSASTLTVGDFLATAGATSTVADPGANTFDHSTIAIVGNIEGTVKDIDVSGSGTNFTITVTMELSGGGTYTLKSENSTLAVSDTIKLTSSLDGQSYLSFALDGDVTGITAHATINDDAAAYEDVLKVALAPALAVTPVSSPSVSVTPQTGALTTASYGVSFAGANKGDGKYMITQSIADEDKFTVVAPDGSSESFTVTAASQRHYFFGGAYLDTTSAWTTGDDITSDQGGKYITKEVTGTASSYSKRIDLGSSDITISVSNSTNVGLGINSLTADTTTNAATASSTLEATIKSVAKQLGELKAVEERANATAANLEATIATQESVVSSIEDADLVGTSERMAELQLAEQNAMEAWVAQLSARKQIMASLSRSYQ